MSTLKTKISVEEVINFLKPRYEFSDLAFIKGGEMSQAFSFKTKENNLILRVNSYFPPFEKDKFASEHFAKKNLPIPETYDLGKFNNNLFFSITQKVEGKILDEFSEDEIQNLMPEIIKTLAAIHKTSVDDYKGYGVWNNNGVGSYASWQEYLMGIKNDTYAFDPKDIDGTMFEAELFNIVTDKIVKLAMFCPNEKYLVHADFGFNNTLSDGEKITGVIDWGESMYGDFLYDIAWLDFYSQNIRYADIFYRYYHEQKKDIRNFRERVICYKLLLGLTGAAFFARSGQKDTYEWQKKHLMKLVNSI